ncbi:glycosyltransferase [Microbulbifer rhizosphaerae]|uniref:GT2 family glycosyltransferase n=1 Tax=Microbulbifer rhizosphaerae TaxID=1562603 RepID=A0A7W4WCZ1_9GAMM|nr:GT2 family glycosyltransferase [Microbulbifer rhizosphaerae]
MKQLFRLELTNRLAPLGDLEACGDSGSAFTWRSSGIDPRFRVRRKRFLPGWYMLELKLRHTESSADARLYFDTGAGLNEAQSVFLPVRSNRVSKRLVYFPRTVKWLRFDPMESAGQFTVEHFHLVRLAPWFALDRLAQRLANMHAQFRGLKKREVIDGLKARAVNGDGSWRELALRHYNETFSRRRQARDYQHWIKYEEPLHIPDPNSLDAVFQAGDGPLISILLPTFNTDIKLLRDCIESVIAQTYPNWQLCIADDCSSDPQLREWLLDYQARDCRISLVLREKNGHISAASNSALAVACGDFVALLDHDDTLVPYSLQCVCEAIATSPDVGLIYSDEDKIDEQGERFDSHFKPAWNPDLLLSQNYICHLTVLRTELVRKVGGFREGYEGSQDHDLLLRCLPYLDARKVVHIPKVLYHWRAIAGSTAQDSGQKSYTESTGLAAVSDYVAQACPGAVAVAGVLPNTYRVCYPFPEPRPLVSLLVPTRNGYEILKPCVDAILEKTDYPNFELLILDNQSNCSETLRYMEEVCADPRVRVCRWDHPFNYSSINNYGAGLARGEILGLVNNDIEPVNSDWLSEMVSHACRPEIGCVGAKLYYPDDTVQHGGVILGIGGVAGHSHKYFNRSDYGYFSRLHLVQNLSAVTGACLLLRKAIFEEVGGLDEENLPVAFNDVDLCLKVRDAGYRNLWTPYAELYHHESVSRGADNTMAKRKRAQREAEYMRRRWGDLLDTDPAYNPNLTLVHEDFSLA